jgi:hypothetical protein
VGLMEQGITGNASSRFENGGPQIGSKTLLYNWRVFCSQLLSGVGESFAPLVSYFAAPLKVRGRVGGCVTVVWR